MLLDFQFVVLGDFNVVLKVYLLTYLLTAGQLDPHAANVFAQYVSVRTRGDTVNGSLLDLVLSLDSTTSLMFRLVSSSQTCQYTLSASLFLYSFYPP